MAILANTKKQREEFAVNEMTASYSGNAYADVLTAGVQAMNTSTTAPSSRPSPAI